tara:strand:- start:3237 stop:3791 length:555 start_codon:yes stop_codon:yes gene_type:complete
MAEIDTTQTKLNIGDSAPDFSLKGVDDKEYSLSDFSDKKVLAVVFMCNHCPYVQAYTERIIKLQQEFAEQGVQFVGINSNDDKIYPEDGFDKMVVYARIRGFNFPYLWDSDQSVAKSFDAQCTPEIMVFDSERKLKYHGRVDDNYQDSNAVTEHFLKDAITALVEGREVEKPNTHAVGCSIKWT